MMSHSFVGVPTTREGEQRGVLGGYHHHRQGRAPQTQEAGQ